MASSAGSPINGSNESGLTLRAVLLECRMANQEETNRSQQRADGSHPNDAIGFQRSMAYHLEASAVIAGGVNSNVRLGATPLCFVKAAGSKLFDLDGNEYIDYALGMGPAILGHAPTEVVEAVRDSLGDGQLYAGQHSSELVLARMLQAHVPSAELVRIGLTGSEMVQAALRVARAYTGRTHFVKF